MNLTRVCPVLLLTLAACGSASISTGLVEPNPLAQASSGLPIERYFPLLQDYSWSYEATRDDGQRDVLIVRARRANATEGELRTAGGTRRFGYTPEGIALVGSGALVLKTPLAVGTTWRGEHGGVSRVEAVGVAVSVPAGNFKDCVVTIEERGGDVRATYTTTFCPGVGITMLEVDAGMQNERAELKSYGPPVFIGPPGTTMTEP